MAISSERGPQFKIPETETNKHRPSQEELARMAFQKALEIARKMIEGSGLESDQDFCDTEKQLYESIDELYDGVPDDLGSLLL